MSAQFSSGSAAAKTILFGEHAVVYGYPAIAIPLSDLRTKVTIKNIPFSPDVTIDAVDIRLKQSLTALAPSHPIRKAIDLFCIHTATRLEAVEIQIKSQIPIASGLGSGAAITIALLRALSNHSEQSLSKEAISRIAYEVEKIHHGTPSGIDNTVIAYEQPIWFIKNQETTPFKILHPLHLIIADSQLSTPTIETVADVRKQMHDSPIITKQRLERISMITQKGKTAIQSGDVKTIGKLMLSNHQLLQALNLSCSKLDQMVECALQAGAYGAKLSGGGRGGNIVVLTAPEKSEDISAALTTMGITTIIKTTLKQN